MDEEQDIAFQRNEIGRKEKAVDARTVKKSGVRNDFRNEAMRRIHTLEQAHVVGCTLNSSGSSMMDQVMTLILPILSTLTRLMHIAYLE